MTVLNHIRRKKLRSTVEANFISFPVLAPVCIFASVRNYNKKIKNNHEVSTASNSVYLKQAFFTHCWWHLSCYQQRAPLAQQQGFKGFISLLGALKTVPISTFCLYKRHKTKACRQTKVHQWLFHFSLGQLWCKIAVRKTKLTVGGAVQTCNLSFIQCNLRCFPYFQFKIETYPQCKLTLIHPPPPFRKTNLISEISTRLTAAKGKSGVAKPNAASFLPSCVPKRGQNLLKLTSFPKKRSKRKKRNLVPLSQKSITWANHLARQEHLWE